MTTPRVEVVTNGVTRYDVALAEIKGRLDAIASEQTLRDRAHAAERLADQRALEAKDTNDLAHFEKLNEAAARSVEERTHFAQAEVVSEQFKSLTLMLSGMGNEVSKLREDLRENVGRRLGSNALVGYAFAVIGVLVAVVSLVTR